MSVFSGYVSRAFAATAGSSFHATFGRLERLVAFGDGELLRLDARAQERDQQIRMLLGERLARAKIQPVEQVAFRIAPGLLDVGGALALQRLCAGPVKPLESTSRLGRAERLDP